MTTPKQPQQPTRRRTVVTGAAAGVAATAVAAASPAQAAGNKTGQVTLTVLGTTDLHGNVFNWDYFKDAEFDDSAHNDIGLAKIADAHRAASARGPRRRCSSSTPATPSRAPRWPTTTPGSSRSPSGADPPDGARR